MIGPSVRVAAHAKLTLRLRVLDRRDDGYHDLDALVVSVGQPHDDLVVDLRRAPGVRLSLRDETDATDSPIVPRDEENLAVRAAESVLGELDATDRPGVGIWLRKRIPAGAGLGGGSADAAAVLVALDGLLREDARSTPLPLARLAIGLGSDVPFCALGSGASRLRGRGEILDPLDLAERLPVVVAVPPFRCPTAQVYAARDELGPADGSRRLPAPPAVAAHCAELVNDLEPAAERLQPRLAGFRTHLERACGLPALMAGSGSAYAVFPDSVADAVRLAEALRAELDVPAFATATVGTGVRTDRGAS